MCGKVCLCAPVSVLPVGIVNMFLYIIKGMMEHTCNTLGGHGEEAISKQRAEKVSQVFTHICTMHTFSTLNSRLSRHKTRISIHEYTAHHISVRSDKHTHMCIRRRRARTWTRRWICSMILQTIFTICMSHARRW